ncbi:uncharacterized protein LOC118499207 [Phyllostomus discolor]|uniref:Uncharacterized protein LOC118499207 n=1 Tax=Phyllostomus discolor TaxID=89673 RepID=A0A7E6D9H9_9CHIR|nr:uncharacterized protein LOC118499207 [Phyllostomus discolor]XP_035875641.1 uncharacterized protein LOC118499207 [Phyllostomus discolor]
MARPPAISMHRARGASVPSRHRRIRRPGRARRSAARRPGPRCPRARPPARQPCGAHCASGPRRQVAPIPPESCSAPDGQALQVRAHGVRPPGDARELGESRGACWPGPPRQGVGAPGPARFRFRPGQRSLAALVADAETGSGGPLFGEVWRFNIGKTEPGEEEQCSPRRGAGLGERGLAVRFARAVREPTCPAKSFGRRHRLAFCRLGACGREAFGAQDSDRGPRACARAVGTVAQRGLCPGAFSRKGTAADLRATGHRRVQGDS